jgi:hypothetical protein
MSFAIGTDSVSHIKQCLITLRFFPKMALTHLTRYQHINHIPSCITCTRGQYTVTKFNCREVKEVFKKNLGMGEWAPPFFPQSSPTPPPPFLCLECQQPQAQQASSPAVTGLCRQSCTILQVRDALSCTMALLFLCERGPYHFGMSV